MPALRILQRAILFLMPTRNLLDSIYMFCRCGITWQFYIWHRLHVGNPTTGLPWLNAGFDTELQELHGLFPLGLHYGYHTGNSFFNMCDQYRYPSSVIQNKGATLRKYLDIHGLSLSVGELSDEEEMQGAIENNLQEYVNCYGATCLNGGAAYMRMIFSFIVRLGSLSLVR